MIPRQRNEPRPGRERSDKGPSRRYLSLKAGAWPEVDETAAVVAALTADTVLQILRGQGHYYGLGAEQERGDDTRPYSYPPPRPRRVKPPRPSDGELVERGFVYLRPSVVDPRPPATAPELLGYLAAAAAEAERRIVFVRTVTRIRRI